MCEFQINHPKLENAAAVGATLALRLNPASDESEGYLELGIIRHSDWKRYAVRLSPVDVARLIEVFRGVYESIEGKNARNGIDFIPDTGKGRITLTLNHHFEPFQGYTVALVQPDEDIPDLLLSPAEALTVSLALEGAMTALVFGLPAVRLAVGESA